MMLKKSLVAVVAHQAWNGLDHEESVDIMSDLDGRRMKEAAAPMLALAHRLLLTLELCHSDLSGS
jgi:hypothetical protein